MLFGVKLKNIYIYVQDRKVCILIREGSRAWSRAIIEFYWQDKTLEKLYIYEYQTSNLYMYAIIKIAHI